MSFQLWKYKGDFLTSLGAKMLFFRGELIVKCSIVFVEVQERIIKLG